jgi:hypothetical protein
LKDNQDKNNILTHHMNFNSVVENKNEINRGG